MSGEIRVPALGESVTEATVAKWFKQPGEAVNADEPLVELETDKVTVEVNAPAAGVLKEQAAKTGATVGVGALLGTVDVGAAGGKAAAAAPAAKPAVATAPVSVPAPVTPTPAAAKSGPAVTKMLAENPQINAAAIEGTGKDGRLKKGDVITALEGDGFAASPAVGPREERVKMSKLRQTIARRLKDSQNTAAILTTFNEIDMSNILAIRNEYKEEFEKKHGIKLGFMGFFVKAAVNALKQIPAVNAEIAGDEIIYKNYYDIGVAVGGPNGLVVPVIRDCDKKSLAQIERDIAEAAVKARNGTLSMADMTGGTFTVSNGGTYGSLMSTPIVNPPQSAILGMHKTEERPVVVKGEIVIRPMMYVAMSYDHRIIDGSESVTFLVKIKQAVEDPRRLLLGL
ncbi:MAG: 2-oxoglutarate dehydrogenase complex dihydrolipoyllysine-residue succinyltransferase [Alphaproteobacteria bacterium]|nr:2-oxoglutarate dehydrogenase complex dihydrolipoyllysine-residue succinyltransferase [Alphaproteobacteria bacterium]